MVTSVMMFDGGSDRMIRCRFVCNWFEVDSYVDGNEGLLSEI